MSLSRGTTPLLRYRIDTDVSAFPAVWLSVSDRRGVRVDLDKERLSFSVQGSDYVVEARLTQAETLTLCEGRLEIQLRAKDSLGNAYATPISADTAERILMEGEI